MAGTESNFAGAVLESLSAAVVGVDRAGGITVWNEAARLLLGPVDEVPATHPELVRLFGGALAGHDPISRAEMAIGSGRGTRTVGFTLGPVRDADGSVLGAVMLLRDLTPFERSDERERQKERLVALGEMAAGMAHEIRNPLAGMEVITGLLRRRLQGEALELVDELSVQIHELADTVSASLDFVRPLAPVRAPVDVAPLIEEALRRGMARAAVPVGVERRMASALPPVPADRRQLLAALENLVSNACEAMAEGVGDALLVVATAVVGPDLVISIEDRGPGVPLDQRERIFYPFFTTRQRGSGVGLAHVQKIAMAHGGSVSVGGEPGAGAIFALRLPLVESRA